jgi:hypothetical protein
MPPASRTVKISRDEELMATLDAKKLVDPDQMASYIFVRGEPRTFQQLKDRNTAADYVDSLQFLIACTVRGFEDAERVSWNLKQVAIESVFEALAQFVSNKGEFLAMHAVLST